MTVVERGGPLLKRGKLQDPEAEPDSISKETEIELANERDAARAEIARLERRLAVETTAARTLRERVQSSVAATAAAEKQAQGLETEFGAVRREFQDKLDLITAGNARLSQCLAERDIAFDEARERIKFLETALSAAEAEAVDKRAEGLENGFRTARDQLQGKLDLVTAENARLSQSAIARDIALGDARARNEFLETALSAAEAECTKLSAEVDGAREKQQSESETLKGLLEAMSSRAVIAEKLLVEARQQSLTYIVENDAFRHRVARVEATNDEADAKNRLLEDALRLQQDQIEELERSRAALAKATKMLLEAFQERDGALVSAEEKVKFLAERCAQLEAEGNDANRQDEIDRIKIRRSVVADEDAKRREDWALLARHLTDFVESKRRSSEPVEERPLTPTAPRLQ